MPGSVTPPVSLARQGGDGSHSSRPCVAASPDLTPATALAPARAAWRSSRAGLARGQWGGGDFVHACSFLLALGEIARLAQSLHDAVVSRHLAAQAQFGGVDLRALRGIELDAERLERLVAGHFRFTLNQFAGGPVSRVL